MLKFYRIISFSIIKFSLACLLDSFTNFASSFFCNFTSKSFSFVFFILNFSSSMENLGFFFSTWCWISGLIKSVFFWIIIGSFLKFFFARGLSLVILWRGSMSCSTLCLYMCISPLSLFFLLILGGFKVTFYGSFSYFLVCWNLIFLEWGCNLKILLIRLTFFFIFFFYFIL